jgi:hypothetical protein
MVAIQEGLNQYVELYLQVHRSKQDAPKLERWVKKMLELTQKNLNSQGTGFQYDRAQQQNMKEVVKRLQQQLVIVPVDKAGHNIAFVCKKWYTQKLRNELLKEKGAYERTAESVEEVLDRHKLVNHKYGFQHVEAFPYLYGILKAHKQPVQLRFIAGCSKRGANILKAARNEQVEQPEEKESEEEYIRRMTREKNAKPKCSLTDAAREGVDILRVLMDILRERERSSTTRELESGSGGQWSQLKRWHSVSKMRRVSLLEKI